MQNYLKVLTFYNSEMPRSLDRFKVIYGNEKILKESVKKLINSDLIENGLIKGKKILIKPNWVLHDRKEDDGWCMRTHSNLILALVEVLLIEMPAAIVIGDAPIQGCDWDRMLGDGLIDKVEILSEKYQIPVTIRDFRRVTFNPDKNNPVKEKNPISNYIIFDLAQKSFLEPISVDSGNIFRVTNYNPDRLAESHRKGMHKYCITKEIFEADLVISMPKIKTHQKSGITAALKNIVGINGDKDYLPHHRIGGTGFGGDCYPGKSYLRLWAELAIDQANRNQGKLLYWVWEKVSSLLWKLSKPKRVHKIAAAWYGNDTTWRMVMDLNKIVIYGKFDGTIADHPQRKLYSLGDGIIGGQGDGPLRPSPLPLGILTFTDNSFLHDLAIGRLMRFPFKKLSLLKAAEEVISLLDYSIFVNGKISSLSELDELSVETLPPPGWVEYLKSNKE